MTTTEAPEDLIVEATAAVAAAQDELADTRRRFVSGDTSITSVDVLRAEEKLDLRRASLKRARKLAEQLEQERSAYAAERERKIQLNTTESRSNLDLSAQQVRTAYDGLTASLDDFLQQVERYRDVLSQVLAQAESGDVQPDQLPLPEISHHSMRPLGVVSEGRLIARAIKEACRDPKRMYSPDAVITEVVQRIGGLVSAVPLESLLPPQSPQSQEHEVVAGARKDSPLATVCEE